MELTFRVLLYKEDDLFVAHCLEMDIKGRGRTEKSALNELLELIEMQINFAMQMEKPGLLDHPAEKKYFDLFNRCQREVMKAFPGEPVNLNWTPKSVSIKPKRSGEFIPQVVHA